ncbi:unnamed protein product [Umbelopsis ramanniana]
MPIRHFDIFLAERRLIQTSAVTLLKDQKIGINANYWLRKVLPKEPTVVAIGGFPSGIRTAIEKELENFKKHRIQPVFVFQGLNMVRKDKPFSNQDTRPGRRENGWETYDNGKLDAALSIWASSGGVQQSDMITYVIEILTENKVEFMRAPYSQWAQLSYMHSHPRHIVNRVLGGSEMLIWDVDNVIVGIDLQKGNYSWLSKKTVLADLGLSEDQFLDVCILAGFDYCPTFPPLSNNMIGFTFKGTHDLVKHHKTGFNVVQAYADDPSVSKTHYIDTFCRTRCAVKYHLVYTDDGEVRPLHHERAPSDLHEIIGYRLPDEVYFYLLTGMIGPQVINCLESGVLIENAPLCNGETQEYHIFLQQLLNIRTQTLSLLSQPLHKFYESRKVITVFWFDPNEEHIMHHHPDHCHTAANVLHGPNNNASALNTVWETTKTWSITPAFIEEEKARQKTSRVDVRFCLKATQESALAAKTLNPPLKALESTDEVVGVVFCKMLEIRDFVTSKHIHTHWGTAFTAAATDDNQEALLTAFELIRFDILTSNEYSKTYEKGPKDDHTKHIRLISRALSLLPMTLKDGPFVGQMNRDILVFNSFVKALNRSYRNLCEMLLLSLFLNDCVKRDRHDYAELSIRMPYVADTNAALGMVIKYYLEHTVTDGSNAMEATEKTFTSAIDLKRDLHKGFDFWDNVVKGIKVLKEAKSFEATCNMFLEADEWLKSRRPQN